MTIEKFLDEYLKQANKFSDQTIDELETLFNDTVEIIYKILGDSAFLLPEGIKDRDYKSPIKIVYDAMMQAFARHVKNKKTLEKNATLIKQKLYKNKELLILRKEKEKLLFDGRYNGRNDVMARIDYYHNFLQNYIS